ncbi:MAG: PadR family transcriptional regulator [Marinifilaceae bacterium]
MDLANTQAQMRKGVLEYCILLILSRHATYAPNLIETLNKVGIQVVEGTIYPLLTRLKNDNLLTYEWQESTQGPPRKYYTLTPGGHIFLEGLANSWNTLKNAVNEIQETTNI